VGEEQMSRVRGASAVRRRGAEIWGCQLSFTQDLRERVSNALYKGRD
jgi:hypothetical protein